MDWVSLLSVLVTLYIYIRQLPIYLSVYPAGEMGALFSSSLNLFCSEPRLLKEETERQVREQRNRIRQPRGLFIIFWNLSEMIKMGLNLELSLQSSDCALTYHVCRPGSISPLGYLTLIFFRLFPASPIFCVLYFRGTLLAVQSM